MAARSAPHTFHTGGALREGAVLADGFLAALEGKTRPSLGLETFIFVALLSVTPALPQKAKGLR